MHLLVSPWLTWVSYFCRWAEKKRSKESFESFRKLYHMQKFGTYEDHFRALKNLEILLITFSRVSMVRHLKLKRCTQFYNEVWYRVKRAESLHSALWSREDSRWNVQKALTLVNREELRCWQDLHLLHLWLHSRRQAPEKCPVCGAPKSAFLEFWEEVMNMLGDCIKTGDFKAEKARSS